MPDKQIQTYLNHHLAASVAWFEALEHLESEEKNSSLARVLTELRAEATADKRVLEELMSRLKVSESETEKATAWLGEKLFRLILPSGGPKGGALHRLLALETLALGLEGRRALWMALAAAAEQSPSLQGLDYQLLLGRADNQRQRVEKLRIESARLALLPQQ